jgi:hypothetical protein
MKSMIKLASIGLLLLINSDFAISSTQQSSLDENQWHYAIDPYGSTALVKDRLINDAGVWVKFNRIPRIDKQRNSWIEVIYTPDKASLSEMKKINLTYKCDIPLLIKLSQKHYGKNGDKSYAHYQVKLPASKGWSTKEVELQHFSRPEWTPKGSKDHGIVLDKVNAIYLTPSLTDEKGGEATLQVSSVNLIQ